MVNNFDIGRMTEQVAIQTKTQSQNEYGETDPDNVSWTTAATVWAYVEDMTSKETEYADKINAIGSYKIIMRYYDLDETQRIVWDSNNLEIMNINHDLRKRFSEVMASVTKSS